jgi:hypothetical protein
MYRYLRLYQCHRLLRRLFRGQPSRQYHRRLFRDLPNRRLYLRHRLFRGQPSRRYRRQHWDQSNRLCLFPYRLCHIRAVL